MRQGQRNTERGRRGVGVLRAWWLRLLKAFVVLLPTWSGFIYLTRAKPVDPDNALIMVWLSALVMILACLPEIFALFKRVKWGDIEVELGDTLKDAGSGFQTIQNLEDRSIFTLKKGLTELEDLVKRVAARPETPVLMKVDVGHGEVSWSVLYTYVVVLQWLGAPVRLVFFDSGGDALSSRQQQMDAHPIPVSRVLGVLLGRRFLIVCQSRWPALKALLVSLGEQELRGVNYDTTEPRFDATAFERLCYRVREVMERDRKESSERAACLSCKEFREWLGDEVDRCVVDLELRNHDREVIEKALRQERRFLIVAQDGEFKSIVALCSLTRLVALETLERAADE